jgi:hypothetical protein
MKVAEGRKKGREGGLEGRAEGGEVIYNLPSFIPSF